MARGNPSFFLQKIRKDYPTKEIEIWFQDETRYGQKGSLRSVWALRGTRPIVSAHGGFKNAYIFGSVNPLSGSSVGTIFSFCDTEAMSIHLNMLSKSVLSNAHIVCILDGAGWHKSLDLEVPQNISLLHLPPYSPELNPIERLWLWIKNRFLSNRIFKDMNDLMDAGEISWKRLNESLVKSICHTEYLELVK